MKFQRARGFVAATIVAASWSVGYAQIAPSSRGYTFRAKYVKGDVRRYRMTSAIDTGGGSYTVAAPFTMTVLSVDHGIGRIRYTAGPVYVGGKTMGKRETIEAFLDPHGEAVKGGGSIQQFGQVSFPEKPIKIGGSWTTSVDAAVGSMPIHVDGVFKLVGFKTVHGRKVAWISTRIKNSKSYPTTGSGTIALDVSDASLVSSHMNMLMSLATVKPSKTGSRKSQFRIKVDIVRK